MVSPEVRACRETAIRTAACGNADFAAMLVRLELDTFVDWDVLSSLYTAGNRLHTVIARASYGNPCNAAILPNSARRIVIKIVDVDKRDGDFGLSATEVRQREWTISRRLVSCPGVVVLTEQHWHGSICLSACPYIPGGDLFNWLQTQPNKKVEEDTARLFVGQVVTAVLEMHTYNYAHRDIKLENILYDPETQRVYLADIEFACHEHEDRANPDVFEARCGSIPYVPPEMWLAMTGAADNDAYADKFAIDVWACGVVLYCMIEGLFPYDVLEVIRESQHAFDSQAVACEALGAIVTLSLPADQANNYRACDTADALSQMDNRRNRLVIPDGHSAELRDLLQCMLHVNPVDRITAMGVLLHPWTRQPRMSASAALALSTPSLPLTTVTAVPAHPVTHVPVPIQDRLDLLYDIDDDESDEAARFVRTIT